MTEPYDPYRPGPNDPYGQPGQPYGGQYGQPHYGQQPQYGQPQSGQPPYGQPPYGQPPYGQPPYGQPQPAQQPYGQPPYGHPYQGSYGQPTGWGTGGPPQPPPPRPPKRQSRTPLVVTAVLAVLLLIGGGVAAAVALRDDGSAAQPPGPSSTTGTSTGPSPTTGEDSEDFEVDQCATLTPEEGGRATVRLTACGGLLSDVVIAKIASSECPEPYLSFNPGAGKFYCLAMDAKEGDCFRLDNLIKRAITCSGEQTRKVVKIFDGVADDSKCGAVPETVAVYAYPDPPMTLCLGSA